MSATLALRLLFFFQAEDGIRDWSVTGVQTCALPISSRRGYSNTSLMSFGGALGGLAAALVAPRIFSEVFEYPLLLALSMACRPGVFDRAALQRLAGSLEIGRASCRGRV